MRKVILALAVVLAASSAAQAQHRHYHGGGGYGRSGGWVAPLVGGLIVGGMVGSVLSQPSYAAPPVYVEPQPYYQCYVRNIREWDPYIGQWVIIQKRFCQ